MKIVGLIPARMASSRFPGKPMLDLMGLPMIEHVYRRSCMSKLLDDVFVATCDQEIFDHIIASGGKAIMTSTTHEMCMDRIVEASQHVDADVYVIIQGDEPLITPAMIDESVKTLLADPSCGCATLAQKMTANEDVHDPNRVKMVWNANNEVLYISREAVPSAQKSKKPIDYYKMICVYAFSKKMLQKFSTWPISYLEEIESIDMLRIVENAEKLRVGVVECDLYNIDVPEDVPRVVEFLSKDPLTSEYTHQPSVEN